MGLPRPTHASSSGRRCSGPVLGWPGRGSRRPPRPWFTLRTPRRRRPGRRGSGRWSCSPTRSRGRSRRRPGRCSARTCPPRPWSASPATRSGSRGRCAARCRLPRPSAPGAEQPSTPGSSSITAAGRSWSGTSCREPRTPTPPRMSSSPSSRSASSPHRGPTGPRSRSSCRSRRSSRAWRFVGASTRSSPVPEASSSSTGRPAPRRRAMRPGWRRSSSVPTPSPTVGSPGSLTVRCPPPSTTPGPV